jgi:NAD(P)-dependent dehydrogenase (short-subunit alcohol dehydrogenase family)
MNPSYDFQEQVALVTGASSGMGLATAQAFAQAGAAIVLADVNETALRDATDDLITAGDQAIANQPIARLGQASEMAAAVLWLCSPAASFLLGAALPVDGGYTAQ